MHFWKSFFITCIFLVTQVSSSVERDKHRTYVPERSSEGNFLVTGHQRKRMFSMPKHIIINMAKCIIIYKPLMKRLNRKVRKRQRITSLNQLIMIYSHGRRGGLMVSGLDSGSSGPGSSLGRGTAFCSWARYFTLIVPVSTQVYKWVPAKLLLGSNLRWTSIPSRGSSNTLSRFMPQKPELSAGAMGQLGY